MDPTRFDALAIVLGDRLDLRGLGSASATPPVVLRLSDRARAVLFRYGVAVLFGASDADREQLVQVLKPRIHRPHARGETEEIEIVVQPDRPEGFHEEYVVVHDDSVERLQLVAEVLARAVTLAQHEVEIAEVFDRIEPLAVALQERGHAGRKIRSLVRHIGGALLVQHRMIGRAQISERPDVLWDVPQLERLYQRLAEYYELRDRHVALERKLRLVGDTAQTLHDLLQAQRSLRVEWYIVALILFDIVLSLYDRLLGA